MVVVAQVPGEVVVVAGDGSGLLVLLPQPPGCLDVCWVGDGGSSGPDPGVFGDDATLDADSAYHGANYGGLFGLVARLAVNSWRGRAA